MPNAVAKRLSSDRRMFAGASPSKDRLLPAEVFLARIRQNFERLGITRIGRLTGLDRIGIPVWMATRPNAANLSVSQGKGVDDAAAAVSAVMEAAEMALAERPHPEAFVASQADIRAGGGRALECHRYLRRGHPVPPESQRLRWVEGYDVIARGPVFVPEEIVTLLDVSGLTYWQSSDGLGGGSCLLEAAIQGLCELIERDASGLWSFKTSAAALSREIYPPSLDSPCLNGLANRIRLAGLRLRLFDMTTDLAVPAFLATISSAATNHTHMRYLDLASGTGAHPVASTAAQRAVLEAAQTRLTIIAGARDDLAPGEYQRPLPPDLALFTQAPAGRPYRTSAHGSISGALTAPRLFDWIVDRLKRAGIQSAVLVPFESEDPGFSICRMFVPDLEHDPRTRNRHLGRRAIAAMMGRR